MNLIRSKSIRYVLMDFRQVIFLWFLTKRVSLALRGIAHCVDAGIQSSSGGLALFLNPQK